ncbi:CBS domain-containing protein [Crenobacter cavernae]|uniref:CBS domain-containing protein n=1 Tax=Crenobacter cavernae TaxID=2290923 RepID=A0ABY0FJ15_9NEIS|nr:CBS domain-containing protein [Crenobacter cavernae]RXZ45572.1 CBS domain-containing protein [Crenobacter cavernae]
MESQFQSLPTVALPHATDLVRLDARPTRPVTMDSPALEVMTDLKAVDPVSIHEDALLNDAHVLMVSRGIRLLFVTDDEGRLAGLMTATDLLGERPVQCMLEHGKLHADILARDVMTPRAQLEALSLQDVADAKVGHMVATMKRLGRQHALVVEHNPGTGHYEVCGLFSTSHMARRLGISLNFIRVPQAFSEIQHSLLHES